MRGDQDAPHFLSKPLQVHFATTSFSSPASKIPRRNRIRVNPQPNLAQTCRNFGICIDLPILRRLVFLIILVVPGHAGPDLFKTHVLRLILHFSYNPPVSVVLGPFDSDDLVKDRLRKVLSTSGSESLTFFRRVDAKQADSMIRVSGIQHLDRIAVLNTDDTTLEDNRSYNISGEATVR